jgi:PKD repeat protein
LTFAPLFVKKKWKKIRTVFKCCTEADDITIAIISFIIFGYHDSFLEIITVYYLVSGRDAKLFKNNMKKTLHGLMFIFLLSCLFYSSALSANPCDIITTTPVHTCAPAIVTFWRADYSGKNAVSFLWDFGDGSTSTDADYSVSHLYTEPGIYTVTLRSKYADSSTCTAVLSEKIYISTPPEAVINLQDKPGSGATQCFRQFNGMLNLFCFTNSSVPGASGALITKYLWNFGDGNTSADPAPCHSYLYPGTYTVSLTVTDSNGCTGIAFKTDSITVLKEIRPKFITESKGGCNLVTYQFKNITDTSGLNINGFYWDLGDGSAVDDSGYSTSHTYEPGTYWVRLIMKNAAGCAAADSQMIRIDKFRMAAFFKDTICWAEAKNQGVTFVAAPQPNVVLWQWNFDDPQSGENNIANYRWTAIHKFSGGPGNYKVHFLLKNSNPDCGTLDTCMTLHIKGPQAMILLPSVPEFPANNYLPAREMPKSNFSAIANNPESCSPQTITYSTFKTGPVTRHVRYKYCNAAIVSEKMDTLSDCYGADKQLRLAAVSLKPADSVVSYYADSEEIKFIWAKGNPIPSGIVYAPSSGTLNYNNIHDSNLNTCRLPNLVRFTNNSIKYRLRNAADDKTSLNVTDPAHSYRDTCTWKTYPMACDSLVYFWKFNDPGGVNCTSTVSNKNWDCNFSTLAAPYHYYRGKNGFPAGHNQPVTLIVTDSVTGCTDSSTIYLNQGPPRAYWDRSAYCRMNWDLQNSGWIPHDGLPLSGFALTGSSNPCAGISHKYRLDFSGTLPVHGASQWWIVFDSAAAVRYEKCPNGTDSVKDFGFTGRAKTDGYPIGGGADLWKAAPWNGSYWYENNDSGCKTIGLVLQNGDCFDTAWYHDYICFSRLDAGFKVFNVIAKTGNMPVEYEAGSSAQPYGIVCQEGGDEGVTIHLYPSDTSLKDVSSFRYRITRIQSNDPGSGWYYNLPFWPDSAVLNPFSIWEDSVSQVDHYVYYIDSPQLFVILNQPGLPAKIYLPKFPLYQDEYDMLNSKKQLDLSADDPRTRGIPINCSKNKITLFSDQVQQAHKVQVLKLSGKAAMVSARFPYPGLYKIESFATNLAGCAQRSTYLLKYGHLAAFDANNDSVICLGQKSKFNYTVRYWSTQCPQPSGGGNPAPVCLNGADEGMPVDVDFKPWEKPDPVAYRDSLVTGWSTGKKPLNFQAEQLWWNFGDDQLFYRFPTGCSISHTYLKPGVYTVSMRTIDWRGCIVTTVRRNLVKVIQPLDEFAVVNPLDTFNYCAPKSIRMVNRSVLYGSSYTDKVVKQGKIIDSTFVVDSIQRLVWTTGNGRIITRAANSTASDSVMMDYPDTGKFDVGLTVITNHGCKSTENKKHYISIIGPRPRFKPVTPLSGCAPFSLVLRNYNTATVMLNKWYADDGTQNANTLLKATAPPGDSVVTLNFPQKRGRFRIFNSQGDTFISLDGPKACFADWPGMSDSQQYWITINPNSPIRIYGNRILSKNNPGSWFVRSGYGEYKKYTWDFGNGKKLYFAPDSSETMAYSAEQCNAAPKDAFGRAVFTIYVSALTDSGCNRTDTFNVHVYFDDNPKALTDLKIFPNPFHSETTVTYTLTKTTKITADLVDAIGREVRLIENETKAPGNYSFTINSNDNLLRSGIYMIRIVTEDGTVVRHLVKI